MEDTNESFDILSVNEQNLINTFGPVTFIGGVSVEPLTGVGVIDEALTLVNDKLTEFAASPSFEMDMQTVFGESVDVELGRTIIDSLHLGGRLPEITVVPVEKMNGIDGGFDSLTGGVYLADTLINPNSIIAREPTQSPNLADVLVEEFGHLLDSRLNQADTPGDEGELFAALVRGDVLGGPEILEFKDEDDRAEINLGRTVEVEASSRQKRARVQPSFREAFASQVGEYPTTVAIGEFNRDGIADLAVTHWFSTDVSVLLGKQGGGFAKATNFFGGGHFLEAVALGEFDGDGALDLALTNLADTSMLLGHGDGHFGEAAGFSTAQNPKSVAVGEFNGDGFLDAAVVNVNSHNLSVLLGKGDGNFEQPVHFDAGQHPRSVAVGEFNSDNVLDLAVVNDLDVLILLGDGDGGFSKKGYVDPGYEQRSVAVGEFNGDGISDLAVVDSYYDKVSVMLGDGKGDFGRPSYLDLETYDSPWSVAAGEINGDGLHDLAVVYPWSESVSVLLNTTPVEPSLPKVSISNTRITEGNKGTKTAKFTVSLDGVSTQRVELDYATANDTARAGKDYKTTKGTLIFNPGEISKTIAVPVVGDKRIESQEQFKLKLSNPTNADIVDGEAIATIRDKDIARVSINNRKIVEGDDGSKEARFKVSLNAKSSKEVEVSYATVDDTAKAGEDYEATEGTLTFKPGQKSKVIKVPVLGDDLDESNERFFVELGDAKNARFKDKRAVGRIADNDTTPDTEDGETEEGNNSSDVPKISISDRPTNESEKEAVFEVYLNTTSTKEVEVSYATADDTAKAGEDYETTKGTLTFEPGKTREEIAVPIIGNSLEEDTENFIVNLSNPKNGELQDERGVGQILDDDGAIEEDVPEISISDRLTNEGEKEAVFEVYLNTTSSKEVEVSYATADDTAKAEEDYEFTEGTLTFEPGETKEEIVVPIIGNSLEEETEDFAVILSNPKNGELKDKRGVGQILDDDAADLEDVPEISISDRLANEGEKQAVFEVYLDTTSTKEVEVSYATADDTAKAGEDYETIKGTLTFEPGETKEEIVVPIIGNSLEEDTENFIVNLSSPKNGELKKGRGVGQILDDDEAIEIEGSEWNASFYEFAGDQPPTDFYLNDSQKLTVQNLGSSENGFNQNWGSGSPSNIPQDKFAVRSYTHADFEEGKVYKARVRADDGYQLLAKHHTLPDNDPNKWVYITSQDEWREDAYGEHQEIEFTVPNSGKYDLHFHYYENTGDAYFDLSWEEKPVDSGSGEDTVTKDRYYYVKEDDTPSDIASNELGDANRWPEIIRGSTGEQLTDGDIIYPGELLILPDGSGSSSDDGNDNSNGSDAGGGENSGSEDSNSDDSNGGNSNNENDVIVKDGLSTTLNFKVENADLLDMKFLGIPTSGYGIDFDAQFTVKPKQEWDDLPFGMNLALEAFFDAKAYFFWSYGTADIGFSADFKLDKKFNESTGMTTLSVNPVTLNNQPYLSTYLGTGAGLGMSTGVKASLENIPLIGDLSTEYSSGFNLTAEELIAFMIAPGASQIGSFDLGLNLNTNIWSDNNTLKADDTAGIKIDIGELINKKSGSNQKISEFLNIGIEAGYKQESTAKLTGFYFDPDDDDSNNNHFFVEVGKNESKEYNFDLDFLRVRPKFSLDTNFSGLLKGGLEVGLAKVIEDAFGSENVSDFVLGKVIGGIPPKIGASREVNIPIPFASATVYPFENTWKTIRFRQ